MEKVIKFVTINVDEIVENIKAQLEQKGYTRVCDEGDRGGYWIEGLKENVDGEELNFTIQLPPVEVLGALEKFYEEEN